MLIAQMTGDGARDEPAHGERVLPLWHSVTGIP